MTSISISLLILIATCICLFCFNRGGFVSSSSSNYLSSEPNFYDPLNANVMAALPRTSRMPVLFLSHSAPILIMKPNESAMGKKNNAHINSEIADWYRAIPTKMGLVKENKPRAIVQFSAHYDEGLPIKILAQDKYKGLLYDYYGFPAHTYDVTYPCPGWNSLAQRIKNMLTEGKIPAELDYKRGIDHGGFIPLMLMYPEADIPVLQISIARDAAVQRRIGELLAPLRDEGILLVGSGQASHGSFSPTAQDISESRKFIDALTIGLTGNEGNKWAPAPSSPLSIENIYAKRSTTVDNWAKLPGARFAHPWPDHYLPLPACVGATKENGDAFHVIGDHWIINMHSIRSFVFGEYPYLGMNRPAAAVAAAAAVATNDDAAIAPDVDAQTAPKEEL